MNLKYFLTILFIVCLNMEKSFGVEDDSGSDSDGEGVIVLKKGDWEIRELPPALSSEGVPSSAASVAVPTESVDPEKDAIAALLNRPTLTGDIKRTYTLVAKLLEKVNVDKLSDSKVIRNIRRNPFLRSLFIDNESVEAAVRKGKPFYLTKDNLFDDLLLLESYLKSLKE